MTSTLRYSGFRLLLGVLLLVSPTAVRGSGSVSLAWEPSPDGDVTGYHVFVRNAGVETARKIDVGQVTTAEIGELAVGSTYVFAVTAYNAAGAESAPSNILVCNASDRTDGNAGRVANLSTRAFSEAGEAGLIGGFIISGDLPKTVVLRALGPSLAAAGIAGALPDPRLDLYDGSGALIASNLDWHDDKNAVALEALGLAPKSDAEAAIEITLPPGSYSVKVADQQNRPGTGLFEVYDVAPGSSRLAAIATRAKANLADEAIIGGFIIEGSAPVKVLARALGPSLVKSGINVPVTDPTLELYNANGTLICANDDWRTVQQEAILATGVPPPDDREAAIVATLPAAAYSAVLRGKGQYGGVAVFELYQLD